MHKVISDYTNVESSSIKVYVRARGGITSSTDSYDSSKFIQLDPKDEKFICIKDPDESRHKYGDVNFNFDKIFWTDAEQEKIFDTCCQEQVDHVMNGVNSCCFAYGQTGSGKTYTMFGGEGESRGVIPRSVEYIFERAEEKRERFEVAIFSTFLEIYNDQIRDLGKAYLVATGLESGSSAALYEKTSDIFEKLEQKRTNSYYAPAFRKNKGSGSLKQIPNVGSYLKEVQDEYKEIHFEIYEDAEGNVFVKDISIIPVRSSEEVFAVMDLGLRLRATHETKMNSVSSRSHCVFSLTVIQRDKVTGEAIKGTINLVDLAGSERVKKSESVGNRLREALHINTSLTALGKVIMALDPSAENTHIPYRDSKLTRILQNTLSGNSFTTLLATIHPAPVYFEECLSTLQFANRCRNVRNHPRVNHIGELEDKDKKIKRLLEEINQLRNKLKVLESREGVGMAFTPTKFITVLQSLGLNAEMTVDGQMVLDGKVISTEATGIAELFSPASGLFGSVAGDADSRLSSQLRHLQADNISYKRRNRELKYNLEKKTIESDDFRLRLGSALSTISNLRNESHQKTIEFERESYIIKETLKIEHAEMLKDVVDHNQTLLRNANYNNNSFDVQLNRSTHSDNISKEDYVLKLEDMKLSHDKECQLIRQQFNSHVAHREDEMKSILDDLIQAREKDVAIVQSFEKEILVLFDYAQFMEKCLVSIEKWADPIRYSSRSAPNKFCFEISHRLMTSYTRRLESCRKSDVERAGFVNKIKDIGISKGTNRPKSASERQSCARELSTNRPSSASPKLVSNSMGKQLTPEPEIVVDPIGCFFNSGSRKELGTLILVLKQLLTQSPQKPFNGKQNDEIVQTTESFVGKLDPVYLQNSILASQLETTTTAYTNLKIANASLIRLLKSSDKRSLSQNYCNF